jgi:hypothetical protein
VADSDITRGKEPITVRITPSLTIFLLSGVASVISAVVWLNQIHATSTANAARIEALAPLQQQVARLEWRVEILERLRTTPAPSALSSTSVSLQTERPLQALKGTPRTEP